MEIKIKKQLKGKKMNLHKGFTLVELLITISIFVIITGVVLVNSKSFDNSVLLHNFAYDVALTIKQSQSYGVNTKESTYGAFTSAYGVYFDKIQSPSNFVLFNDVMDGTTIGIPDKKYNGSLTSCPADSIECMQKYTMTKGTSIQSICAGNDESSCNSNPVDQLSILFKRPKLDANIYTNNQSTATSSYAKIVLSAANGATSSVVVTSAGQIYVKK